uniref:cation transporter n=1 Tax=Campylobacter concisus TaxID=199 RepID=UPI0015E1B371
CDNEFNSINKQECTREENDAVIAAGACAFLLALVKCAAGVLSGSVAGLGSEIDSMLGFVVSLLNLFALRKARKQAEERFNFGYTRLEAMARVIVCVVIDVAAGDILYESGKKFSEPNVELSIGASIGVRGCAVVVARSCEVVLIFNPYKRHHWCLKADANP